MLKMVVLISGTGSNLKSIMDAVKKNTLHAEILAVISNRDAPGLEYPRQAGIPHQVIQKGDYPDREAFDKALADAIDAYQPDLIILAGFMLILGPEFVKRFDKQILNIHPSLLPKYPGADTHQRVLDNGDSEHGATVHVVTETVDDGPIIMQTKVPVLPDDDAGKLAARVLVEEHRMYPLAIREYAREQGLLD